MDDNEKRELLKKGASELDIELEEGAIALFLRYLAELKAWNRKINLTSIEEDREIIIKHFLDSLIPLKYLNKADTILDVGSGGGFPGIPLKIAAPSLKITLMDTVQKKVHFMRHIIRTLGLTGIEALACRVEDPSIINRYKGSFDCVTSRAFTELKNFLPLALPYLRTGGVILAMKGPGVTEELKGIQGIEGVNSPEIHEVSVPFLDRTTNIVILRKL